MITYDNYRMCKSAVWIGAPFEESLSSKNTLPPRAYWPNKQLKRHKSKKKVENSGEMAL